jgi:hypothetical protein
MFLAFELRQWLHKGASMLCYIYIASLVNNSCVSWICLLNNSIKNFIVPSFRNCVERSKWISKYFCVPTSNMLSWWQVSLCLMNQIISVSDVSQTIKSSATLGMSKTNRGALTQCFSTIVRPRPGKFFFHKTRARSQHIYS